MNNLEDRPLIDPATTQSASADHVVVADCLCKTYHISRPPRTVLNGVSVTIPRGQFVALMGPSGCGKSTLLHILGGLEAPDAGSVSIEGTDLYALNDARRSAFRRNRVGFVFQFFNLLPNLSAAENIALPLQLRGSGGGGQRPGRTAIRDRVKALMDQLNLHGLQGHGPEEISGGEQQRVAIARALAAAPALVLADEPTGNLDWISGHEVMSLLARIARVENHATVVVTHEARIAAYADRVLLMKDGALIDDVPLEHAPGFDWTTYPDPKPLVTRLHAHNL